MTLEELKELIAADRDGIAGIAAGYLCSTWLEHLAPELIAVAEAANHRFSPAHRCYICGEVSHIPCSCIDERLYDALVALDAKMEGA